MIAGAIDIACNRHYIEYIETQTIGDTAMTTAPMTTTRKMKAQRKAYGETTARKSTRSTRAKDKAAAPKARPAGTFTTVDIANEQGISAKTLRARIRRNIDDWAPLFHDGVKHVFKDNKTNRAKIEALMA